MADIVTLSNRLWNDRLNAEDIARLAAYQAAWEAYSGRLPDPLKVRAGQVNDNVRVNFCRVLADKAVSMLFGMEPFFQLDETRETPEETWLAECWHANRKMTLLQKIALNGALFGHVFVKIMGAAPYPRLINVAPEYVTVEYDPDDIEQVTCYLIEYPAMGEDGAQLTIRQTIERRDTGQWTVRDEVARGARGFETVREELWPYPWPPMIDCQNLPSPNEFYGLADVSEDLIELNKSINFVLSNTSRILRFHAHPKTWGKGFGADQLKVAVDETIILNSPDAELHNLEMTSDLASSLAFYEHLKAALHEVARTPEVAMGRLDNIGALSGVALQVLYAPLIEKTETKRLTYGDMLIELNRRLLEMGGYGDAHYCMLQWPELLPGDPVAEGQALLIDKQLGVSADTLLRKRGYDADQEAAKRAAEDKLFGNTLLTNWERTGGQGIQGDET